MLLRHVVPLFLILGSASLVRASSPDPPNNVSPPNSNVQVPAETSLCAQVSDADLDTLNVRFLARELTAAVEGDFTIIAIPDSQFYTQRYPEMFYAQTDWVVEQRAARNIAFVAHVGDIVHLAAGDFEWSVADEAMSRLEDPVLTLSDEGIPYGMAVGNHDQDPNDNAGTLADPGATTQNFNSHFGIARFQGRSYWGGHYGDNADNSYQLFSAGGMDFILINLEFDGQLASSPLRDDVLAWADALLKTHADRRGIISSHHLLCASQACPRTISAPFSLQGQETYDALKNNPNLFLMLAGHAGASDFQNRRLDTFDGREIHTLMSCYHFGEPCPYLCGNGYMRIMTFSPATDSIDVKTYSPYLDQYKTTEYNEFGLNYDMNGGRHFREVGVIANIDSGSTACLPWSGLTAGAEYEWYVEVSDGTDTIEGPRWTFTDNGSCASVAECDDGDLCTTDDCAGLVCTHNAIANCCVDAGDCDDANPCTDDVCTAGSCANTDNTKPCTDGDACTESDTCFQGACAGTPMVCDDGNVCSDDFCLDGSCETNYLPSPGCCALDGDCNDNNPCTDDTCDNPSLTCANTPIPGCCLGDVECADADTCTLDVCAPRNRGALILDSPYDHVSMVRPGYTGGEAEVPGTFPGLNASRFTVELWFQWAGTGIIADTAGYIYDDDPGGIQAYPLVSKGIRGQESLSNNPSWNGLFSVNYFLGILEPGHVLAADLEEHQDASNPALNHPVYGTTVIDTGVWHHAAVTYDGNCWQLYLDGQPETDGTNCPSVPAANDTLHFFSVGAGQGWEGLLMGSFDGKIDEVRVWNRALEQAEIQSQMYSQIVADPNLLGRWSFDDLGIAPDTSGNENTGNIVGAALETEDLVDLGGSECVNRTPVEVSELLLFPGIDCDYYFCPGPSTFTKLRWAQPSPAGMPYDVVSGTLDDLKTGGRTMRGICIVEDTQGAHFDDTRAQPAPGEGFYYLIREQGTCAGSTYGIDSLFNERLPNEGGRLCRTP